MLPIRTEVALVAEIPDEFETWTLRQAIDWWKNTVYGTKEAGMLTESEMNLLNDSWVTVCKALAKREDVPAGVLSYFLGELAQTELRLVETAQEELGV